MQIRFHFNPDKAVQVMAFIVGQLGSTDKVKLMKLVYLSDREHFIRHGYPITGDRLCAMPWGPVPSGTLNIINGELVIPPERVFSYLHVIDNAVTLKQSPGTSLLSVSEQEVLSEVSRLQGAKYTWDLVHETHRLPEYADSYVEGSSRFIPYELIARHSGNENRYRLNRPVISVETAARMVQTLEPDDEL